MPSGLYGIYHSNRAPDDHWGKNCFNSSFPAALACYMLDKNIPAVYIKLEERGGKLAAVPSEITLREAFNCGERNLDELYFSFESVFEPYQQYSFDTIDGIDLVIKDTGGSFLSPLEVKLTVIPTSATSSSPERL